MEQLSGSGLLPESWEDLLKLSLSHIHQKRHTLNIELTFAYFDK